MEELPPGEPAAPLAELSPAPTVLPPRRPRVWTVFVALVAAIGLAAILQIVTAIIWAIAKKVDMEQLQGELAGMLSDPSTLLLMMSVAQLAFAIVLAAAVGLSPVPWRERIGWYPTSRSIGFYLAAMFGSLFVLALGVGIGTLVAKLTSVAAPTAADQLGLTLYKNMTPEFAVVFVLFIAFVPGFVEEAFYRGYMQRRLLERTSAGVAIGVVGILFAISHGTVQWALQVLPLGIWFGLLAWRTNSIWPGIACHAFVNGARNVWGVVSEFADVSETAQGIALLVLAPFAAASFFLAAYALRTPDAVALSPAMPMETSLADSAPPPPAP